MSSYCCISIHLALSFSPIEKTENGGNEWQSITYQGVDPVKFLQPRGIKSPEEDEVDIHCHSTRPHRIRLHKPESECERQSPLQSEAHFFYSHL
jgi:hypothetical protein